MSNQLSPRLLDESLASRIRRLEVSGQSDLTDRDLAAVLDIYSRVGTTRAPPLPYGSDHWIPLLFRLMKNQWARLRSFYVRPNHIWPHTYITPGEMASAGFFFVRFDTVQCAYCHGMAADWQRGQLPFVRHSSMYPRCPLIEDMMAGLEPFTNRFENQLIPIHGHAQTIPIDKLKSLYGIRFHLGPKHRDFLTSESRKKSFESDKWDRSVPVSTDLMVDAGFFFAGYDDHVKCFYCDGCLYGWESGDEPWVEHAKWFAQCQFVALNKSQEFIDFCRIKGLIKKRSDNIIDSRFDLRVQPEYPLWSRVTRRPSYLSYNSVNRLSGRDVCGNMSSYDNHGIQFKDLGISSRSITHFEQKFLDMKISSKKEQKKTVAKSSTVSSKSPEPLCKICLVLEVGVAFLPCGHQACTSCTCCLTRCHICRSEIRAVVKTYFA